ncbi:hypothetical protein GCM10023215_19490 [Pseudonocardia yuanmonensis]|uniref:Uncharacterized protein n=1 Tax=Pseudonocardia yuanmonensis TaxID=1095914 RepID=A0ABP8W9G3_9PSEU
MSRESLGASRPARPRSPSGTDERRIWPLHERAEATIAAALAERFDLPPGSLEVRARAAVVNAALRVATDDLARAAAEEGHVPLARWTSGGAASTRYDPVVDAPVRSGT